MSSFKKTYIESLAINPAVIKTIRKIAQLKGKQDLYQLQAPEKLENLRQVALIQSVESSNRIEGVTIPEARLKSILAEKTTPKDRSEGEIAGYRDVLNTIHEAYQDIPVKPSVILQLHRDLFKFSSNSGGKWKVTQNEIEEISPEGERFTRFKPTPPHLTDSAMEMLCQECEISIRELWHDPLILIPLYILDFLCIHPFLDGNGRISRILTTLMLYQQGYEVVRYVSLERLVEQTKEQYYETLYQASQGWHEGQHDPLSWIEYWLSVLSAAYTEMDDRLEKTTSAHGKKADVVLGVIDSMLNNFSISDIEKQCPNVGRDWIKAILKQLKKEGIVSSTGKGRGAKWIKN